MTPHPLAVLFPLLAGPDFERLCADIREHGLREPIVIFEGKVLDGRNRLRACIETGTPPVFREWGGSGTALDYVISMNLHRRHLDPTQLAMVAARVATMTRGRPTINTEISAFSQGRASELFNVSPDSIQFARRVIDRGTPELIAACDQGTIVVSQAAHLADADPAYQLAILDKVRAGLPVMEARRQLKQETLDPIVTPGFPDGPFRTIVIDPPWPIEKIGLDRRPNQFAMDYQTMTLEEITALPIPRLANQEGTHVYLWVTHRFLPAGLALFDAWGVRYECVLAWIKPTAQPLWWRYLTEPILFGKIGSLPPLRKGEAVCFNAPQQRHSHKPDQFFDLVRRVSPEPRLTMFDGDRAEFTHWGVPHDLGAYARSFAGRGNEEDGDP